MSAKDQTKTKIKQEFINQLREKPLKDISVKELTENCGLNRNTFYYHYRDLNALAEDIIQDEVTRVLKAHPTIMNLEDCLYAILDFLKDNRRPAYNLYHSVPRTTLEKFLWKICHQLVLNFWQFTPANSNLPVPTTPEDEHLLINFFTCECFGQAIHWLDFSTDDAETRKDIHRLTTLILGNMPVVPKNPPKSGPKFRH